MESREWKTRGRALEERLVPRAWGAGVPSVGRLWHDAVRGRRSRMSKKQGKSGLIPLSDMIAAVRWELGQAADKGRGQDLRFLVEEVELELSVTAEHDEKAGVKINVLAFEIGAEDIKKVANVHRVKVKLKPVGDAATRGTTDVLVSGEGVTPDPTLGDVPMGG